LTLPVTLGELKTKAPSKESEESATKPATPHSVKIAALGISAAPLDKTLRTRYGIGKSAHGVVVTEVSPDGPAAAEDIQTGDVISEAAQQEVKSAKQLAELADAAKKDKRPLLLLLNRGDEMQFVAVGFGKGND
ncbi:MAG: PDZ domain-containing protein, partial [Alphaproteobacteria bacterium]|nr:PDZ domain-containing protein [Alphaproteobacteria bacterium]